MKFSTYRFLPEQNAKPYRVDHETLPQQERLQERRPQVHPKGRAPPWAIESLRLTLLKAAL